MMVLGCHLINPENVNYQIINEPITPVIERWEYTSINGMVFGRTGNNGIIPLMERTNELGEEGWQLVSSVKTDTGFVDRNLIILFFKRRLH